MAAVAKTFCVYGPKTKLEKGKASYFGMKIWNTAEK
jgi:hypothetical protein